MKELLRTTDEIRLSYLQAMLRGEGIDSVILDRHASILEGSIGALPRRLMVDDDDYDHARRLMDMLEQEVGEGWPS
ncbi:DUF2007 domain-containing protein [Aestuariispira insulae]|uniref:Putative signal transducing protein n=1 Tax=Aestuariispira insulae TaxID=1461337 RepID=A0A3D9HWB3_9PROT|nr:DUF2007 domain-containing protein [Aestuariispira insulae]RED53699.1 putative signal transducing protein [Aestuariispira insulae]